MKINDIDWSKVPDILAKEQVRLLCYCSKRTALYYLKSGKLPCIYEISIEPVEDEFYVSVRHPMTREYHISFLAFVSDERLELVKLYPEGDAAARFSLRGGWLYASAPGTG